MTAVNFYTSCTMTKSVATPEILMAQKLRTHSVKGRFLQWRARIDSWKGERLLAHQLYSGGNWSAVRKLATAERTGGHELKCYVISAGYGLVKIDSSIAPYAATFGLGHEDSVIKGRGNKGPVQNAEWWQELCQWRPIGISGPRSLREAFKRCPDGVHIFALSPFYFDAISEDLAVALTALSKPERLVIISAGKRRHGDLNRNVIQPSSRLQTTLGGALGSLNVRVATAILNGIPVENLNHSSASTVVSSLLSGSKPRKIPQRIQLTDSAIIRNIVRSIKDLSNPSYTGLLRELRDSGHACEMKRFKRLFQTVTNPL